MKKVLLFLTLMVFGFSTFAQNGTITLRSGASKAEVTKDSFYGFNAVFAFDKIESSQLITEKGTFSEISIDGTFPAGAYGEPSLPVARQLISIPQGATPVVKVVNYTETVYSLEDFDIQTIYPQQPSVRKDMRPEDVKFIYNERAYTQKGYSERPIAQVEVLGNMRAARIGTITINPVVYDASTNTIKVRNNVEVAVEFQNADRAKTERLYAQTTNPYFAPFYNNFFNKDVYTDHPDLYNTPVRMLVIANRMFEETLQPWLQWKTEKGFYLDVNYTDQIGTTYAQIRDFVHGKYNAGLENGTAPTFVVIVGDVGQVANTVGNSSQKVTDLYYGSADGDYFPDMFYSRMSAETTQQLANIIEKTLVYEKFTMADPSYLNNVLLIAGADGYWNPRIGQPTIKYAKQYYFNEAHGFDNVHAYLSAPYSGCYSHLSTGVGFANYTAHGDNTMWADPMFTTSNVNTLTNQDKYFLAMGNCCLAANFGHSSPSFGEAMIRGDKKGAFAYIGSCPNSYWYEDYYFGVGATNVHGGTVPTLDNSSMGVYDAMFTEDAYHTVSSTLFAGNLAVTHAHSGGYQTHSSPLYYWQAYHVLGDGSVMPFYTVPEDNVVEHAAAFPIGQPTFTVSALPGSYVAISKGNVLHGTAQVGATGSVDVELVEPITSGGSVRIVVTAPQRKPYIADVEAASVDGAYVIVDSEGGVELAGDGILSYGETTGLSLKLKNIGAQATSGNVTVTISSENPKVTIGTATATVNQIAPDQIQTATGLNITVNNNVENDEKITFKYVASDGGKTNWEGEFFLIAKKPVIDYVDYAWSGAFTANSEQEITVNFTNNGGFQLANATVALATEIANVTVTNVDNALGTIAPGETKPVKFKVAFGDVSLTQAIPFTATVSGDNGAYTSTAQFTLANECNLTFTLNDSYGDGWNGATLTVSFNNDAASVTMTGPSQGQQVVETLTVASGTEVTLTWKKGSYDAEISFTVTNEAGEVLFEHKKGEAISSGVIGTFVNVCGNALSINDMEGVVGLRVYPNPVTDILNVQGENIKNVVMYNSLGQAVKVGMENNQINVSSLNGGIYYLVIMTNDFRRSVEKIVIAK